MVVGALLDQAGRPPGCELWPGNQADVKTLIAGARLLRERFGVQRARLRAQSEVRDEVLSRAGRYQAVRPEGGSAEPDPLEVNEVWVGDHRYIVCRNAAQARKDAADREAILAGLRATLQQGAKALVGNDGFRRYLRLQGEGMVIDEEKACAEARFDGKGRCCAPTPASPRRRSL